MEMFDFVVVGAGPAGCAIAARLSEDPTTTVLLLEAGPPDSKMEIRIPAAFTKLFKTEYDWAFTTEPEAHLQNRRLYWPRGRTLGGSSAINAQMYVPGRDADFDEWEKLGCRGWSAAAVKPYFDRSLLHVSQLRDPNPLTDVFLSAAQSTGLVRTASPNEADNGVAVTPVMQRNGQRFSAADAYLRPARGRPNLVVRTGALVLRIALDGRRATGVEYEGSGRLVQARARKEVVLSAGAIGSPHLLLLSGVGPAQDLVRQGIECVHDLPGVGANLQDHLAVAVVYGCTAPLTLVAAERPSQLIRYFLRRRGMLTSNAAEAAAFVRTRPDLSGPDLELLWTAFPVIDHALVKPSGHGMTIHAVALRPASRGRICISSPDPRVPPAISACYVSDPDGEDLRVLREGVRRAQGIFGADAFSRYLGPAIEPQAALHSRAEIEGFIREQAETLYHPVGSCRMGNGPDAVVDPELRVKGIEGLRVADASVMPLIIRGHPQAATVMIGERAADLIRGMVSPAAAAASR
jgi:choline dehydrogenase-like flavoprotein